MTWGRIHRRATRNRGLFLNKINVGFSVCLKKRRLLSPFLKKPPPMWVLGARFFFEVTPGGVFFFYSSDEFLTMAIKDLEVSPGSPGTSSVARRAPTTYAQSDRAFVEHRTKDGTPIDVEITSFSIRFAGESARLSSVTDVTYLKRTEAPEPLSRSPAGDRHRRGGRQRREVHPHRLERGRRVDLRPDGRTRSSDSPTRWCFAPTSSASNAPRPSNGWSRPDAFMAS